MSPKPLVFSVFCLGCGEYDLSLPYTSYTDLATYFKGLSWSGDHCPRCARDGVLLFWEQRLEVES